MKSTGIVRKVDPLGRIVLPSEIRQSFGIEDGDSLEIYTDGESIILKKYAPSDVFTGDTENLIEYRGKKVSVETIKELARIADLKIAEDNDSGSNTYDYYNQEKQ